MALKETTMKIVKEVTPGEFLKELFEKRGAVFRDGHDYYDRPSRVAVSKEEYEQIAAAFAAAIRGDSR